MGKNKKVWFLTVALIGILGVAGCGNTQTAKEPAGKNAAQSEQSKQGTENEKTGGTTNREYPIGDEKEAEGMTIAAVYLQPVQMEPVQKAGLKPTESDIHLEADITANENNPLGFGVGEFVPYLTVKYELIQKDTGKVLSGNFMPMNAGDGSHYGANVKMPGAGNYSLKFFIESPEKQDFLIHTDKETGVPGQFWTKPIELNYEFSFVPRKW